jgi:hypothetical protein
VSGLLDCLPACPGITHAGTTLGRAEGRT